MGRRRYVQIEGVLYEHKDAPRKDTGGSGPTIIPDIPDFVSPIDGKVVSGRAGLRDHCARHNIVPTAELKGLPTGLPEAKLSKSERIEDIRKVMIKKGYL